MPYIKIIKNIDNYGYEYIIVGSDNKKRSISKNGFKTRYEALEAGKRSYNRRKGTKSPKIKNFKGTNNLLKILNIMTFSGIGIVLVAGSIKLIRDFNDKFPFMGNKVVVDSNEEFIIKPSNCDFSNLYVIIRSTNNNSYLTAKVIENQLNNLSLSNKIISKDKDYIKEISKSLEEYPESNIIFINLEEELDKNNLTILNDYYNINKYPSDVLSSCINASASEYNFNTRVKSGKQGVNGWRLETSIEKELFSSNYKNSITQLSISLPNTIENEITRNDAASSIVEGLMRFSYLPKEERYKDIYYCAKYGDTIIDIAKDHNITFDYIMDKNNMSTYKNLVVGETLIIGDIPSVSQTHYTVDNPNTTTNIDDIKPVLISYIVKENDTLTRIAKEYGVNIENIIINSNDPNKIKVGEEIIIVKTNYYLTSIKNNNDINKKNR